SVFMLRWPPAPPLFPYTTLFRSLLPVVDLVISAAGVVRHLLDHCPKEIVPESTGKVCDADYGIGQFYFEHVSMRKVIVLESLTRSEEHTSELQSRENLVCRLLLE